MTIPAIAPEDSFSGSVLFFLRRNIEDTTWSSGQVNTALQGLTLHVADMK
jgi:hypothetical protein